MEFFNFFGNKNTWKCSSSEKKNPKEKKSIVKFFIMSQSFLLQMCSLYQERNDFPQSPLPQQIREADKLESKSQVMTQIIPVQS